MYSAPQSSDRKTIGDDNYFALVDDLLKEGREVVITPKGNSMLPFIRNGRDEVVLTRLDRPAEIGDILLAKIGERFIMHRVFAVEGDSITLMGDGNVYGKEYCGHSDIIGLVTEIRKAGGRIVKPGKGKAWRLLRPFRRYILAIYKRVIR